VLHRLLAIHQKLLLRGGRPATQTYQLRGLGKELVSPFEAGLRLACALPRVGLHLF
jgi:hypothetical protein